MSEGGIDLATWREQWTNNKQPNDLAAFGNALAASYIPNLAIVDCTASDAPPQHYLEWMKKGINIITPNKKLGSGPLDRYTAVRNLQRESYIHFFYEVRAVNRLWQCHTNCTTNHPCTGNSTPHDLMVLVHMPTPLQSAICQMLQSTPTQRSLTAYHGIVL